MVIGIDIRWLKIFSEFFLAERAIFVAGDAAYLVNPFDVNEISD